MKKLLSLLLCVAFALSLCACSTTEEPLSTTEPREVIFSRDELQTAVAAGEMTGVDVRLGDDVNEITDKMRAELTVQASSIADSGADPTLFEIYEGRELTCITYGANQYFYLNDNEDAGIAVIACAASAYKFNAGNCYSDDIIHSLGEPDLMDIPDEQDLFYLFGTPENVTRLTYTFDKRRVDFILVDDNLCMSVLTDISVYDGLGHGTPITTATGTTAATTTESAE